MSLNIDLSNDKRLLPNDNIISVVNQMEQYNKERKACRKVRLTCSIDAICSNVLFNNITEIVHGEGTDDVSCINFGLTNNELVNGSVSFKNASDVSEYKAVRNTELSSSKFDFKYHCGLDIFNNHLLRSDTFRTVCFLKNKDATSLENYNTIGDTLRSIDGEVVKTFDDRLKDSRIPTITTHLYNAENIKSFKQSVTDNLIEENGWFGFKNVGRMVTYDENGNAMDVSKVLNNKKGCDFIDMYPERDLYSFIPKYNSYKKRIEKNWNYCLTYPSKNITSGIDFLREKTNSLRVIYFDDEYQSYNGTVSLAIYSVSQHGLKEGDNVNIYVDDEIILNDVIVNSIIDEYAFTVDSVGVKLADEWYEFDEEINEYDVDGVKYTASPNNNVLVDGNGNKLFVVNGKFSNNIGEVSYKKTINGIECQYYIRVFSRLPNWRFNIDAKPTDTLIYDENRLDLIEKYQGLDNDFESHCSRLGFAKNSYGDDKCEVVYVDDIDISSLRDNLGRPLTEIYFTIIKNNKGYKKWYGIDGVNRDLSSDDIEYSHCFGKVNCAFKLSPYSMCDESYENASMLNSIDNINGLPINMINPNDLSSEDDGFDEINYYYNNHFYGDLCSYNEYNVNEEVIQQVYHRFNTAQRELGNNTSGFEFKYDELVSDDNDSDGFKIKTSTISRVCERKEGYLYNPHYKIEVMKWSNEVETQYPKFYHIKKCTELSERMYELLLMEESYLEIGNTFYMYDNVDNEYLKLIVYSTSSLRKVVCLSEKELDLSDMNRYRMFKPDVTVPRYAQRLNDGSCRYVWRNLIVNGFNYEEEDSNIYPFTNGAFYINLDIKLYVKRQDPDNTVKKNTIDGKGLSSSTYPFDTDSKVRDFVDRDTFVRDENIIC